MSKYDDQYYIVSKVFDENTLYLKALKKPQIAIMNIQKWSLVMSLCFLKIPIKIKI